MKILIIGTGNIGSGFARILNKDHEITLFNRDGKKAKLLAKELNAKAALNIDEGVKEADLILLCIKPQNLESLSADLYGKIKNNQIVVSVLSGTSKKTLQDSLGTSSIFCLMPNIPAFYKKGVFTFVEDESATFEKKEFFHTLFSSFGKIFWVDPDKFQAMTALAGSGPAFAYIIIESAIDAGIAMGLSSKEAKETTLQMFHGALTVLEESGKHPGELKWEVTSPAGCTIAGIKSLENHGLRSAVMSTFLATYEHLF